MAERRMFAKSIINSDAFIELSAKAQMLYIHLGMAADDDGFLNNTRAIKNSVNCSDDELQELYAKRFLIDLGDGITVIKHWRINNYIQKDRYKPTTYSEKFELLEVKDNGSYTEKKPVYKMDTECIHIPVYSLDTQVRLGKDSIGKVSIGKGDCKGESHPFKKPTVEEVKAYAESKGYNIDCQRFVDYYESKGWMVGKSKMKKWEAAVNNWAKNDKRWSNDGKPDFDLNVQKEDPQDFSAIRKRLFNAQN